MMREPTRRECREKMESLGLTPMLNGLKVIWSKFMGLTTIEGLAPYGINQFGAQVFSIEFSVTFYRDKNGEVVLKK